MKGSYVIALTIGVIGFVAVLTNPDQNRHKEVIRNKINVYMQESIKESLAESNDGWEQTGQALGMMLGGAIVDRMIESIVSTDNYILFSITKITWDGQTRVIGIGAFGNVYLTNKLDNALNDEIFKGK